MFAIDPPPETGQETTVDAAGELIDGHSPVGASPPLPNDPTEDPLAVPPGRGRGGSVGGVKNRKLENVLPAAKWQASVEHHRSKQALTSADRVMIMLGVFLLIAGSIVNMLPLMGIAAPLFREEDNLGPVIGLFMGLLGAGLLSVGLRRFKTASAIGGPAGGVFIFLIFTLSIVASRESNDSRKDNNAQKGVGGDLIRNTRPIGSWYQTYPEWTGFSSQILSVSPADQWQRVQASVAGISATLPGNPNRQERKLIVDGKNVTVIDVESRFQQQVFRLSTFEYPIHGKSGTEKLDAVEKALGNVSRTKYSTVDSFPAREFTLRNSSRGLHGVIVAVGETIAILRCEGVSTLVPGEVSNKMLASLRIDPSGTPDPNGEIADTVDPPTVDADLDTPKQQGSNQMASQLGPLIELTEEEENHESDIIGYIRSIETEMQEGIHLRSTMKFAPHYLTVSAGKDTGPRRYLTSPGKAPIVGIDFVQTKSGNTFAFTSIVPVYDISKRKCQLEAKPGFALSGIRVNAKSHVEGVRFVFSKITDKGFDISQSYESDWFGTPAAGSGDVLSGDGRPVYGLWMCKGQTMRSIGLIREKL